MFDKKRCPKCKHFKSRDQFSGMWCDECQGAATDEIMKHLGYVVAFSHTGHHDDAEDAWQSAWDLTLALPRDYPDYAELCEVVSSVCPVPEVQ